jgi:hypothetical protein
MSARLRFLAEAVASIGKASTWRSPISFPPYLPDQNGWQNSVASAAGEPRQPRQPQRVKTVAKVADRACDRGRARWKLDAVGLRYYLMTTWTEPADGRNKPETP